MTSGVFLSRLAACSGTADALGLDVAGQQLAPAPGHGAGVDAQQPGDLGVAAVADLEGFQPGVEAPLALIEQAVEQHDGGLELVGERSYTSTQPERRGFGVIDLSGRQLGSASGAVGHIHVATGELLSGQASRPCQRDQGLFAVHVQDRLELAGVIARLGGGDQRLDGGHERPGPGEPHLPE